jgi:hypothetical protein
MAAPMPSRSTPQTIQRNAGSWTTSSAGPIYHKKAATVLCYTYDQ